MKKRVLSILLVIVVLVGLLPVTAFAAAATNIKVFDPVYYDSGALKSITTSFGWSGGLPSGRLVLTTKYLRSEGSNGYAYGDFSDLGYYAKNFDFRSFNDVLAHDQANGDIGIITYTEQKSIAYSNNSMTFSFTENNIPLSKDGTYYVYFWTIWGGEYYPDNLIMAIEVKNGGVSYTVADSSKGRNALSGTSNQVTSSKTYNVTVTAAENMTKTNDSGATMQSNLNSAMTPVVFTANVGYAFPDDYAVATINGIMVRRDNAEQITVYGTPTDNTTITLPAPTRANFTVKYMVGENVVHTEQVGYGRNVANIPEIPVKEGYTAAWDSDGKNITEDTTINAVYTVNQHTITFDTDGGGEIAPITQDYGTAITAPAAPTKTGYTFAGWDTEIPATMPAKNMTIRAKWNVNQHTLTFDTDGGSEIAPITQDYGTAITAPAAPTKTGYTFAGWDTEIPATMPAKNMTIRAKWNVNQHTITFDTDGGSEIAPITQDYGTAVTAPAAPTKTGYTFAGWDTEIPATMPAKNMTIKAKWTVNQYTVTYKADGKVVKTMEVEHGKDATAPEIPAKEGYNETAPKWDKDGKNITADTEINAVYTKNQPGEYADVTPDTNVGGGKITEKIEKLKEKVPVTQEEEKQIEYGADVEVWLEIKDISASVPADDKKEIEKKLGDGNVAMYLDIAMFKRVGENEASRLTQLSDKVQITFKLDDSYINTDQKVTRTYSIIHVHDGKAEMITPVFDAATKTLTFETDRFSTYGVVYTDKKPTPPAETPATGDSFQPVFWIACMTLSIFGIAVLLLDAKRRHAR